MCIRDSCLALAIVLCMFVSVGVMGATIPSFNKLISKVSPEVADYLYPIQLVAKDNGIKTEIVAALNDDDMAIIYINIQDLEKDRVDDSVDFYNYSFNKGDTFGCQLVDYDESNKTATMRIMINGGKALSNKDIVFRLSSFLSGSTELNNIDTGINISDFYRGIESESVNLDKEATSGYSVPEKDSDLWKDGKAKILPIDDKNIKISNVDFMHITNIGVIDGELHIQTKWTGKGIDDHGWFYFTDKYKNKVDVVEKTVDFDVDENNNFIYGDRYQEYIYDLKDLDIEALNLMAEMKSSQNYIEGNWKTKFKLKSIEEKKEYKCSISIDNIVINKVILSPLGLTLYGDGTYQYDNEPNMEVILSMKDGTKKRLESKMWDSDDGIQLKCLGDEVIKVEEIQSISINGTLLK